MLDNDYTKNNDEAKAEVAKAIYLGEHKEIEHDSRRRQLTVLVYDEEIAVRVSYIELQEDYEQSDLELVAGGGQ